MGVKSGRFIVIAGFFLLVFVLSSTAKTAWAVPAITSPVPDSTLKCSDTTFTWRPFGTYVADWGLYVGTEPGGQDIINTGRLDGSTTYTLSGIPEDGSTIYARLWYFQRQWFYQDFQYTAASDCEGYENEGTECDGSWSKVIPNADDRFELVMGGAGVLDKETCLVWEREPGNNHGGGGWVHAHESCHSMTIGGRQGWRLPTVEELLSLVDDTQVDPALPSGHPFVGIRHEYYYWTSMHVMPAEGVPHWVWAVHMSNGGMNQLDRYNQYGSVRSAHYWCVRGGYATRW